jgi:fructose-1,6-bisphosphatase/inositol monophosphatase family enzyme
VDTHDIAKLLQTVAEAVIRPRFRALAPDQIFLKGPGDYVTVADRQAEVELTRALNQAFPDALVVGEEAAADQPDLARGLERPEHVFVVDPVDGTGNFVRGDPDYAVMVGELRHGQATRGWIWQPEHGLSYVGQLGAGVERNGHLLPPLQPLARSGRHPVGQVSRSRLVGRCADSLARPLARSRGCAGVDYTRLLEAQVDFIAYKPPKPWDHVPGALMLRELGGVARLTNGAEYIGQLSPHDLIVAADPATWAVAQAVVRG